jgi:hypothetical protein
VTELVTTIETVTVRTEPGGKPGRPFQSTVTDSLDPEPPGVFTYTSWPDAERGHEAIVRYLRAVFGMRRVQ